MKYVLRSASFVATPQIIDVDDEATSILTDHVADLALIHSLVLLEDRAITDK